MSCFYKHTDKKPLIFLLVIIITCQLVLAGSFLLVSVTVMAQEKSDSSTTSAVETTPPEDATSATSEVLTPTERTTEPIVDNTTESNQTTTENIIAPAETMLAEIASSVESAEISGTTTSEISTTTLEVGVIDQGVGTAQALILGTGDSNSNGSDGVSQTGLTMDTSGGSAPQILAKWEMDNATNTDEQYIGNDEASSTGAQFLPSGQLAVDKTIVICALVADNDGATDLDGVYASTYYPERVALAPSRQVDGGCGKIHGEESSLKPLSQERGVELFCNRLKNNNNNLPTFNTGESFDSICAPGGALEMSVAKVYCEENNLAYDDPAGDYKVEVYAQDKIGNFSPIFADTFKYLELTAFAVDFNNINYGLVQLNTPKIIQGNLNWETPIAANPATIRNVGNTRIQLVVKQNDFGLGKTANTWNVNYQARVGSTAVFVSYPPEQAMVISQVLDLAEANALDFGIEVYNFPPESTSAYAGQMTLAANKAEQLNCH